MQSKSKRQCRVFPLKKEQDIQNVFSKGRKYGNQYSVLYFRHNTQSCVKAGIFVPKKVFKKAVDRNRAKRIIREVIRQGKTRLQGLDIICILKRCRKEELSLQIFRERLAPLLQRIQ